LLRGNEFFLDIYESRLIILFLIRSLGLSKYNTYIVPITEDQQLPTKSIWNKYISFHIFIKIKS